MVTRPRNLQQADPYFDSVVLLCPLSGEHGDTTTTDLSNEGHTMTFAANASLDANVRKFGFTSCLIDDTDGKGVYTPTSAAWANLKIADGFTVEAHVNYWGVFPNSSGGITIYVQNSTSSLTQNFSTAGSLISAGVWHHVVFQCQPAGNFEVFVDGTRVANVAPTISELRDPTDDFCIGATDDSVDELDGWVENVRITKGVARYTDGFTPPERAYPTVQNVDGVYQLPDTSTITYDSISSSLSAAGFIVDFVWNEDGTKWIFTDDGSGGSGTGEILYADVSTPYDISTLSTVETPIDTTLGRLRGIQWSADGTQLYVTDYSTGDISSFGASPAYDITSVGTTPDTTTSLLGNSTLLGMHFTDDGKYLIVGTTTSTAWLYPLSTAWDISTIGTGQSANLSASGVTRSDQLIISNDGTRIWQLGLNTEDIHQWTLTTPFDLSTASWDGAGKDFALQDSGSYVNPTGMTIHPTNRNELYVTWTLTSYRIQKYTIG
jgi:hypothetical protein